MKLWRPTGERRFPLKFALLLESAQPSSMLGRRLDLYDPVVEPVPYSIKLHMDVWSFPNGFIFHSLCAKAVLDGILF